jgi:hypothetical protein
VREHAPARTRFTLTKIDPTQSRNYESVLQLVNFPRSSKQSFTVELKNAIFNYDKIKIYSFVFISNDFCERGASEEIIFTKVV